MMSCYPVLLGQLRLSVEVWCVEVVFTFCVVATPAVLLFALVDQIRIARRGRVGGSLLLRARAPRWQAIPCVAMVLFTVAVVAATAWMGRQMLNPQFPTLAPPLRELEMALTSHKTWYAVPLWLSETVLSALALPNAILVVLAIFFVQGSILNLELRARGIFHGRGFVPWSQVTRGCWLPRRGRLRLEFGDLYRLVHVREDDIGPTDALLRQYVEVADEADATSTAWSRRRKLRLFRLQFGLSTLLLGFVFAALLLGTFMMRLESIRGDRQIASRFTDGRGEVEYTAGRVWGLDCASWRAPLAITDDDLVDIEKLRELSSLNLANENISDVGLSHVASAERLTILALVNTKITDAGLEQLSGLVELRELFLSRNKITGSGLRWLDTLSKLEVLDLGETDVDDAGLKHLAKLDGLTDLNLHETRITDAGLKHLARLPKLVSLELGDTQIIDAALADLEGMKQLEYVGLTDTRMTPAGVARLQQALPTARIDFTPPAVPIAK